MIFTPLITLRIQHEYLGEATPPISVEADVDTLRVVAGANLRLRAISGRLDIFADDNRAVLQHWTRDGTVPFVFRLRSTDPDLPTVTAGLATARRKLFLLDSDLDDALARGDAVPPEAIHPAEPGGLVLTSDALNPPMAIMRMRIDPKEREIERFVRFEADARHWIYNVVGGPANANYSIRDSQGNVEFENLGDHALSNGARAVRFRSNVPIPVRARPQARFELMDDGPFGERVVVPVLPAARAGVGTPDPAGNGIGSDIYVNLT